MINQRLFRATGVVALAAMLSNTSVLSQNISVPSYEDIGRSIASSMLRQQGDLSFPLRGTAIKSVSSARAFTSAHTGWTAAGSIIQVATAIAIYRPMSFCG